MRNLKPKKPTLRSGKRVRPVVSPLRPQGDSRLGQHAENRNGSNGNGNGQHAAERVDLAERVKDLLRLAREQGHLTYGEIADALPRDLVTAEDMDGVLTKFRNLEIEIIDPAEIERGGARGHDFIE